MAAPAMSSNYFSKQTTDDLIAARDRLNAVLDFRARQHHLFDEAPTPAPLLVMPPPKPAIVTEAIPDVLSPSSVNAFHACAAKWYYRKILQLPETRTAALVLGSAVHEAAAVNSLDKIETGHDLDYAAVRSVFREALRRQLAEGPEVTFDADESVADLEACGDALVRVYLEQAAPTIFPAKVELPVEGKIGDVKVHGFVDVLDRDGVVIDLKTAGKKPSGITPEHRLQVSTYAMVAPGACGRGRRDVITKTKTVGHYTTSFEVAASDRKYTERLYSITLDQMRSGLIAPNRSSFLCSRRNCSFWQQCQEDYGGEVAE